jgi:hypothetical protein
MTWTMKATWMAIERIKKSIQISTNLPCGPPGAT